MKQRMSTTLLLRLQIKQFVFWYDIFIEDAAPVITSSSSFTVNENTFDNGDIGNRSDVIIRYSLTLKSGLPDNRISVDNKWNLSFIT